MKNYLCLLVFACLLAGCSHGRAQSTASGGMQKVACSPASAAVCSSPQDAAITDKLRQAIIEDQTLSVKARNIIIRTDNGLVSLKGSVNGMEEERKILEKTTTLVGIKGIDDQLNTHAQPALAGDK